MVINYGYPPTKKWGECNHPKECLRFDLRFGLPIYMYCLDCGKPYIHPFHGFSKEEIVEKKEQANKLYDILMGEDDKVS
jgi:uncharacterized metal-binding protein YceD (DUF177 family)